MSEKDDIRKAMDELGAGFAVGGRGDRAAPGGRGWYNERDRDDDEPQDIGRRLTHEERYGVRSNVPFPGDEK